MADDIVKEALDAFAVVEEAEADNRACFLDDTRFSRLSEQWDTAIEQERRLSGRPCLTINKLQPVIRQVVNDARLNRPAAKVHPCDDGSDPETAEVLGGLIRNIEVSSDADVAYDTAVDNAVSGGFGYWRINLDYALNAADESAIKAAGAAAFDQDIFIRRVANPLSVYGDPYSQQADSSDWMQAHVIDILTRDQFKKKYPGAKETDFDGHKWSDINAPWRDGDSVQVAEYWKREKVIKKAYAVELPADENGMGGDVVVMFEDEIAKEREAIISSGGRIIGQPRPVECYKVRQHIVTGAEELDKTDWVGSYIPIIPVYGDEVNIEGKRYFRSLIRDAKDAQRNFNYWRTTATELIALAPRVPYIGPKGAFKSDVKKWATANSVSHAFIEYDGPTRPDREAPASVPSGVMQEALSAADDIKAITGIYDASLGARSNETSGKAINARQREGDVSTYHFIDNLNRAIRHSGRVLVDLMPKVYSTERIARILGEDGTPDKVRLNADPRQEQVEGSLKIHDIRTGRYDVTVTTGPSFSTRREEAVVQMTEFIRSFPEAAPIIGDLLAKNMDWPGADEIAKRLKAMVPPAAMDEEENAIPPEVQAQMQQMQQAIQVMAQKLQEAEQSKAIDAGKLKLDARKIDVEEYKAETDRMQAIAPALDMQQVQAVVLQTLSDLLGSQELPEQEDVPMGQTGMMPEPAMGQRV